MRRFGKLTILPILVVGAGMTLVSSGALGKQTIQSLNARVVAINIPGAAAIAQIGTFLNDPTACARPIPTLFSSFTQTGAVLDPARLLVGSRSNFGAQRAIGVEQEGSFLSIDPNGPGILIVPATFASAGDQASTLGGAVQMFSANSPSWANSVNNPGANTKAFTGVSNPLGLSNNNAFGRIWPANAPFGDIGRGSSSILDPTGLPLKGAPNSLIGGVYVGGLTNRSVVTTPTQPQVIAGSLKRGAVGTALLGPSPDGTCRAVFVVATADGAIVQEHTAKGLDGLAPPGTVQSILGRSWDAPSVDVDPRFGVIMNPYTSEAPLGTVRQLFVSEPFNDTIAVVDLTVLGIAPNQVFGLGKVRRISSPALNLPVDLAPVQRDATNVNWASNTTLDDDSDFFVANRGNNTIVRMQQNGHVVAIRRVTVDGIALKFVNLNGIASSTDGSKIYVTFTGPEFVPLLSGVLELPAF
jgi:hypothetical protein